MASPIYISEGYIQAGEETTFGSEAATILVPFGVGQLASRTARNNLIKVRGLGSRNITNAVPGKYEGSATVSWTLANGYWLKPLLGSVSDAGTTPYTHTYSEANTLPSFTLEMGFDLSTDSVLKLLGCTMDSVTLRLEQGAPVTVEANITYTDETEGTSLDTVPAADTETPFSFAQGSLEVPDGATIDDVQSVELTIGNNPNITHGLGSRHGTHATPMGRDYTFNISVPYEAASTFMEKFYGSVTGPNSTIAATTFDMVITNGLADADERKIYITLAGVYFDEHTLNADSAEDLVREGLTGFATSLSGAVYSNNTATDPW